MFLNIKETYNKQWFENLLKYNISLPNLFWLYNSVSDRLKKYRMIEALKTERRQKKLLITLLSVNWQWQGDEWTSVINIALDENIMICLYVHVSSRKFRKIRSRFYRK